MHLSGATAWRRVVPTRASRGPWSRRFATAAVLVALFSLGLVAAALQEAGIADYTLRFLAVSAISVGVGALLRPYWPAFQARSISSGYHFSLSSAREQAGVLQSKISEIEWLQSQLDEYASDLARTHQELHQARSTLEETYMATLETLASAVDARDPNTYGHCSRVAEMASLLAKEMGLPDKDRRTLARAALLHDIGKLGVPDSTLSKSTSLTEEEVTAVHQHPELGCRMLCGLRFLGEGLPAIRYHHERFDGTGYPYGLAGEQIPLLARILAVADSYDAITSDRPYRNGQSRSQGIEEIVRCAGTHFDPAVVAAFLRAMGQAA